MLHTKFPLSISRIGKKISEHRFWYSKKWADNTDTDTDIGTFPFIRMYYIDGGTVDDRTEGEELKINKILRKIKSVRN